VRSLRPAPQLLQVRHLVTGQRLGRIEVEGARVEAVAQHRVEHWQVVRERLARRRRRRDHRVLAVVEQFGALALVAVQLDDAARVQRVDERWVQPCGERLHLCWPRRLHVHRVDHARRLVAAGAQPLQELAQVHARTSAR